MARTDAIVLGAGIVGTSIAAASRQARALGRADRPRQAGEETSYGNAGVIEGKHNLAAGFSGRV